MAKSCSIDLRERVVTAVTEQGMSCYTTAAGPG